MIPPDALDWEDRAIGRDRFVRWSPLGPSDEGPWCEVFFDFDEYGRLVTGDGLVVPARIAESLEVAHAERDNEPSDKELARDRESRADYRASQERALRGERW